MLGYRLVDLNFCWGLFSFLRDRCLLYLCFKLTAESNDGPNHFLLLTFDISHSYHGKFPINFSAQLKGMLAKFYPTIHRRQEKPELLKSLPL